MVPAGSGPEQVAREKIDAALVEAGWIVQHREDILGDRDQRATHQEADPT